MRRKKGRRRKNRIHALLRMLILLAVCAGIYPGFRALYKSDLLPDQYRPALRKVLQFFDEEDSRWGDGTEAGTLVSAGLTPAQDLPEQALIIDCIDVGQGDCTLIRQGEHAMLFDCGCEVPMRLRSYFREQGIKKFEAVWLSHADADHISAFPAIAYEFEIGCLFTNDHAKETYTYEQVMESADLYMIPVTVPAAGETYTLGDAQIFVTGPVPCESTEENDSSLAVRIAYEGRSVLLCGDASDAEELAILDSGAVVDSDILHVSHHGSNLSSSGRFLDAVSPAYAVISCGTGNDYGHPGSYTLGRLARRGISVLRTDLNGTVRYIAGAGGIEIQAQREAAGAA